MTTPIDIILSFKKTGQGDKQAQQALKDIGRQSEQAGRGIGDLEKATGKAGGSFTDVAGKAVALGAALGGAAIAAKAAYEFIGEGANLQKAQFQFERLSESIGTTADSMLGSLRAATKGMVSDAELVAAATDIINLGLGKSEGEVVRLATAVSTLGLDMQQVILTFANNSTARLDALGLSVEGVTEKAKELEAAGFEGDAFDEAVLIGLEEKMTLLGDASETTAGKMAQMEASMANLRDVGAQMAANALEPAITNAAGLAMQVTEMTSAAQASGTPLTNVAVILNEVNKSLGIAHPKSEQFIDDLRQWESGGEAAAAANRQTADSLDLLSEAAAKGSGILDEQTRALEAQRVAQNESAHAAAVVNSAYLQAAGGTLTYAEAMQQLADAEAQRAEEQAAATQVQVGAFRDAESAAEELISAQAELASAQGEAAELAQGRVAAAQAVIQDSYRQTAFEALLAGAQTAEAFEQALGQGVAIGAITQEQADLQRAIGGTQLKIDELNQRFAEGDISANAYATAFNNLASGTSASTDDAIENARKVEAATNALTSGDTSNIDAFYQDIAGSAAAASDEIESDVITPEVDNEGALAALDEVKGKLEEIQGTYEVNIKVNQSGGGSSVPTSNPGNGGFATGGLIGSGTPISGYGADNVAIAAQTGEFVLRKTAVNALGVSRLNFMNSTGRLPGFAEGGLIGSGGGGGETAVSTMSFQPIIQVNGMPSQAQAMEAGGRVLDGIVKAAQSRGLRL